MSERPAGRSATPSAEKGRRRRWLVAVGAIVLLAVVLALLRVAVLDRRLTGRPEHRVGEALAQDAISFISVAIRLHHDALAELVNQRFPASIPIPEASLAGGSRLGVRGAGQVERLRPVTVAGAGDGVVAATRLRASFTLGNELLGVETLTAQADVTLALAFDIDADWRPVVSVRPRVDWIQPPESRLTRRFNIPLAGLVDQQVQAMALRLEQRLPDMIEERFRLSQLLRQAWEGAHARLQVVESPAAWLTMRPLGAHFMTPAGDGDALLLNAGFSAAFGVSQEASGQAPPPTPLPMLGKQPPPVEGIRLAVPVTVDYGTLSGAMAAALRGRAIDFPVRGGMAGLRIDDAVVYPSAPQVVVGVHLQASVPRRWLDTRGWVYLAATPVFDPATGVLELADLQFARAVDNGWVRLFSAALHDRLLRELQQRARFELGGTIAAATGIANEQLHARLQQAMGARLVGAADRLAERVVVRGGIHGVDSATIGLAEGGITLVPVVSGSLLVEVVPLAREAAQP